MYKLENNVEWTNNLKDAFKHNITRAKIVYDNTEINYDNGIKEITLEDSVYVPDVGFIGQATSKKLTLILLDNEQTINLENKEFELYIGADYNNQTYYINYGKFIVNEPPENDSTNGTIKILAYDYMIKFNKIYQDEVTYPIKLKDYLSNICTQAGVQLGSETFPNQNFWVSDNQFEGKQLREVIKHIAKCAFSWARIGQDNKLYLDFNATGDVIETFGLDNYKQDGFKRANEYYGPINKVTYADSDIQGQEKSVFDENSIALIGTKELVIYDNFFAYTTQKRQDLVQSGNVLFGFNYMPVTQLELTGAIYLDCTDIIEIVDDKNNTIITRVFSHTIKYNGAISDTVSAPALSNNQETYKNINTTTNAENRTEIMVDRANKKIQSITSQIGNRSQKTTTITQDIDGINSKVEDIEDLTRTATGNQTVTISDAFPNENILELHIYGNNSVFNYLLPSDDLYPEDNLYPFGDSRIRFYNDEEDRTIELGIEEVLRANTQVKDEVFIDYQGNVSVIRRVNSDGTTKATPVTTALGQLHFKLIEGNNTFEIVNYIAPIEVKYAIKSTYTDIFATKVEMNSSITQTAEEINLEVSKKVDEDKIISRINQSAEQITIDASKINLNGSITANGAFKIDTEGNMECNDAKMKDSYMENITIKSMHAQDYSFYFNSLGKVYGKAMQLRGNIASNTVFVINNDENGNEVASTSEYFFLRNTNTGVSKVSLSNDGSSGHIYCAGAIEARGSGSGVSTDGSMFATSFVNSSENDLKENIHKLKDTSKKKSAVRNGIDILKSADIYEYNFKGQEHKQIGVIIGEKYNTPEEILSENKKGIDLYSMVSIVWKAVQEQQEQIEELQKKDKEKDEIIKNLLKRIERLEGKNE